MATSSLTEAQKHDERIQWEESGKDTKRRLLILGGTGLGTILCCLSLAYLYIVNLPPLPPHMLTLNTPSALIVEPPTGTATVQPTQKSECITAEQALPGYGQYTFQGTVVPEKAQLCGQGKP